MMSKECFEMQIGIGREVHTCSALQVARPLNYDNEHSNLRLTNERTAKLHHIHSAQFSH